MDNRVYKDFAYTRHERIVEVLIYWVDIESHSSRPEIVLVMRLHYQYLCSCLEGVISIYFHYTGVRTKTYIDRFICCVLASKT